MKQKSFLSISAFMFLFSLCYGQVWSTLGSGTNGGVNALAKDTSLNQLYVGGQFTIAGSISAQYVAKWNGTNWDTLCSGVNNTVHALAMYNGELYAGGYFTVAGGDSAKYIAKWNGTSWMPVGTGLNNAVFALAVYNGELYAGGNFTTAGGISANYIAKWDGVSWSSIGTGVDNLIWTLLEYNGKLYAGGWFTNAGGNISNYIVNWDGSTWSSVGLGTNSSVRTLATYNGKLYLGGGFTMAGNIPANYIASWNGSDFDSLGTGLDNYVYTLDAYNCELYAGGSFDNAGGISAKKIAKWNGTAWTPVGSAIISGGINALSAYNDDLYVGGTIFAPGNNILKWNIPIPSPPNASFLANDSTIQMGNYIQFTNTSTTGTTAQWSFQGGIPTSSSDLNPIIYYQNIGIYDVTLIVTNCAGADTLVKSMYINVDSNIHSISYGISSDFLEIIIRPHTAIYEGPYYIYYYKPLNYDTLTSPILFAVHGLGGNGNSAIGDLQAIADNRNALIVAPNMHTGALGYAYVADVFWDSISGCYHITWMPEVFKQIYRHVLHRENRDSIPAYLIGFSAGGQFTTRYMLVRQFAPDSIPLRMAVSSNPSNYTLCTDTFNNAEMLWYPYRCGLAGMQYLTWNCAQVDTPLVKDFICDEHVMQYYNENYGILIGTADTETFSGFCPFAQGTSRYERARNFYNFSDTNAITRGTTLKWQYDSVVGIAHDGYWMYNTKRNVTDSSTIAETLLFDSPYHTVPSFAPVASFIASDTVVFLPNAMVLFSNQSTNTVSYLWDFGDSLQSTEISPLHLYQDTGTYTITLVSCSTYGCSCDTLIKQSLIEVKNPGSVSIHGTDKFYFSVYPNPSVQSVTFKFATYENSEVNLSLCNILGQPIENLYTGKTNAGEIKKIKYDLNSLNSGVYIGVFRTGSSNNVVRIIKY